MNYQSILKEYLLSQTNIDYIINLMLSKFKISQKAIPKCINIISNNFIKYLNEIDRFPKNNEELSIALQFLNKKCMDDFTNYLINRYPNRSLNRNEDIQQNNSKLSDQFSILSIEDTEKILNQHGMSLNQFRMTNKQTSLQSNLEYLISNPNILQMFNLCINQINPPKHNFIIDAILDKKQVEELLNNNSEDDKHDQIKVTNNYSSNVSILKNNKTVQMEASISEEKNNILSTIKDNESIQEKENKKIPTESIIDVENFEIDFTKKITKQQLPLAQKKINELLESKNNYISINNLEMIDIIDDQIKSIIQNIKKMKNEFEIQEQESKENLRDALQKSYRRSVDDDNVEFLDLEMNPTNDYNDQKNIMVQFEQNRKMLEIAIIDYYLPHNSFNVNRFNNKFSVYFNGKTIRFQIPPADYDINSLINYIKSNATFLDFNISDDKIITITNNLNVNFDLMITMDDNIFKMLGFNDKSNTYRDKKSYVANREYNLSCNDKVFFSLSGTSIEPVLMEFDKKIEVNKILRKSKSGFNIRRLFLVFKNDNDQYYDFIMPFKICLKLTYESSLDKIYENEKDS
uniref:Uncharacterized protein n=1 Tax=viral metagenome TaxID=1070528 RepID=A0A6C0LQR1_9ZZZZ